MRQITIRNIPDEVEAIVRSEADSRGVSLNKAYLTLLKRGAQYTAAIEAPQKREKGRFARFCGIWSEEEAAVFDESTLNQRPLDPELWQ